MNIPKELIDEVIQKASIVDIINEHVHLEKKGNDYKGLCPFHNDTSPSLSVSPKKNVFNCFSCGVKGNVVFFLQKKLGIHFIEALKIVASKVNVDLNIKENPNTVRFKLYQDINEDVCNMYEFVLKNTVEGESALKYLESRHIDSDIIKKFRIGLASRTGNTVVRAFVETKKYLPLDLINLSLIGSNKNSYYDLFKDRIIFPISDLYGNIIGFNGRIYTNSQEAKYINSKENILFKKGKTIYNYHNAISEIRKLDKVVLFEGGMDVIAAYRGGVFNAIATMGTALTEEQANIILKTTSNIILCYDGDNAGISATKKAIDLFTKLKANIKIVLLPTNQDPDDYLNNYGKKKFQELINESPVGVFEYLYKIISKDLDLNDQNSINKFLNQISTLIEEYNSKILENYVLKNASKELNISIDDLKNELTRFNLKTDKVEIYDDYQNVDFSYDNIDYILELDSNYIDYNQEVKITPKITKKLKYLKAEENIVYLAFNDKSKCMIIKKKLGIDEFVDKVNRDILFKLYDYYDLVEMMDPSDFFKKLEQLEIDRLNLIINNNDFLMKDSKEANNFDSENIINNLENLINVVKKSKYQKKVDDIKEIIKENKIDANLLEEHIKTKKKTINIKKK